MAQDVLVGGNERVTYSSQCNILRITPTIVLLQKYEILLSKNSFQF